MRLFHISEESNITIFRPRVPLRDDLDKSVGLVWAIDEERLPNFLFPRECPRICYHVGMNTNIEDTEKYFTSNLSKHTVVFEHEWYERIKNITLYLYEFSVNDFVLQDAVAGYYIATTTQIPINKYVVSNVFEEFKKRNIEIRIVDNLMYFAEKIKNTTLNWSLCRMRNASRLN